LSRRYSKLRGFGRWGTDGHDTSQNP